MVRIDSIVETGFVRRSSKVREEIGKKGTKIGERLAKLEI